MCWPENDQALTGSLLGPMPDDDQECQNGGCVHKIAQAFSIESCIGWLRDMGRNRTLTSAVFGPILPGNGHERQNDGCVDQIAQALIAEYENDGSPAELPQAFEAVGALARRAGRLRD